MNQDNHLSREKLEALDRLIAAIRLSQSASGQMDEAFGALIGVNRTDGRCLDIVQRLGQITAGELARQSGLTTGAVTAVIDRMEQAGYLRRVRDPTDRRKVHVELTQFATSLAEIVYSQYGALTGEGLAGMEIADIELIAQFLRSSASLDFSLAELLRDYVDARASDPVERLRAARNFAARVAREATTIQQDMHEARIQIGPDRGGDGRKD